MSQQYRDEAIKEEIKKLFNLFVELQELTQNKHDEILDIWQIGYKEQERLVSMHISEEVLKGEEILFNEDTLCFLKDEFEALRAEQNKNMIQLREKLKELLKLS